MRLIFAGTPGFAAIILQALVEAGHEIAMVLTQPDRASGRGLKLQSSPVKTYAVHQGLPLFQPGNLRGDAVLETLRAARVDVMVVAAYGLILPAQVLAVPPQGCVNVHASLLPRWRGAAPIQRAILAGDTETGITIMQMDEGLDTGAILLQQGTPIEAEDTAGTLHDRLAQLGARCIVEALYTRHPARPQDSGFATYAAKITKAETRVDWETSCELILRQVRAYDPQPGATTELSGAALKIWRARHDELRRTGKPGTVLAPEPEGLVVAAGDHALRITELQLAGGKRMAAAAFLAGRALNPGERLGFSA